MTDSEVPNGEEEKVVTEIKKHSGHHLRKLNFLSKSMSEVLHEIMSLIHAQLNQVPLLYEADSSSIDIKLVEQNLWIDRIMIPLNTRPRTLSLLQAFFDSNLILGKEDILEAVYGPKKNKSPRFIEAQDHSLTKLVSRTRHYLETCLSQSYQRRQIDWMVFDTKKKVYHLYLIRKWEMPTDPIPES